MGKILGKEKRERPELARKMEEMLNNQERVRMAREEGMVKGKKWREQS